MKIRNVVFLLIVCGYSLYGQVNIEKWKIFELALNGPTGGNPFKDVQFSGRFIKDNDTISVPGFYDGEGIFKIRFMPQKEGSWNYVTTSNFKKLDNKKGSFVCTPAHKDNHGPVVVTDTFYFAYADGTQLLSVRNNLLRLGASGGQLSRANTSNIIKRLF